MAEAQQATVGGPDETNETEKAQSYEAYLQLDKVLDGVRRLSKVNGDPAHDEHLFIIIHQAFEIWFKQILFDLDSIIEIFDSKPLLIDQFYVIETMPPLNFLEFRCHLGSASGFQSLQFRLIENKFGLKEGNRVKYGKDKCVDLLSSESSRDEFRKASKNKTLFEVVETWLESIADIDTTFWQRYKRTAESRGIGEDIEEGKYKEAREKGSKRLSYKAFQGALRIALMRDEQGYSLPFQVMTLLMDVDALIMKWRYHHVLMVHRMIGSKAGTGGSSGYNYLKSTVIDQYRVFIDFFNLSTFLVPRKDLEE